jgi:hypothetical protein
VKYVQIIAACDMTRAQTGEIEQAAETVYLAFGADPKNLKVRELDLSEEWSKELHASLLPYLNASHEPGDLVTPGSDDTGDADATREKKAYKKAMVAWAQANGYNVTRLVRGGWYPPVKTKQAYAHHVSGRDDLLTEANGLQPDYDPVTGNSA